MKIDRLLSIVMILLERKKVSASELARTFEVSARTIYRDVETINQAGLPVVAYPGVRGGIGILESYKPEKRFFSAQDVTMILMGLGSVRSSFSNAEVTSAIAKIKGMVPEADRKAIEIKAGKISVDLTPWGRNGQNLASLTAIQQALENNRLLRFGYRDRKGQTSARCVEPYRLILKKSSWYLGCYCLMRHEVRLFKVVRMSNVSVEAETFTPRDIDGENFIVDNFDDAECFEGLLRVQAGARETILELFGDSALKRENESNWLARIPLTDNEQSYGFVAGLGSEAEVLEPIFFRERMLHFFQNAIDKYR